MTYPNWTYWLYDTLLWHCKLRFSISCYVEGGTTEPTGRDPYSYKFVKILLCTVHEYTQLGSDYVFEEILSFLRFVQKDFC